VDERIWGLAVSPDNRHMAAGLEGGVVQLLRRDGGAPITLQASGKDREFLSFSPDGRLLIGGSMMAVGEVQVWDVEARQLVRTLRSPEPPETLKDHEEGLSFSYGRVEPDLESVLTLTFRFEGSADLNRLDNGHWMLRRWPLDGGPSKLIGAIESTWGAFPSLDPTCRLLAAEIENEVHLFRVDSFGSEPPRVVGRLSGFFGNALFDQTGGRLATCCDSAGTLRVWSLDGDLRRPEHEFLEASGGGELAFSPDGSQIAVGSRVTAGWLWNLRGPASAAPLRFGAKASNMTGVDFTPDGRWLATIAIGARPYRLALWPLWDRYPRILRVGEGAAHSLFRFHPDGSRIFTIVTEKDGTIVLLSWPLSGGAGREPEVLFHNAGDLELHVDPQGRFVLTQAGTVVQKIPLDGTAPTVIDANDLPIFPWGCALDPTGRLLACRTDRRSQRSPVVEVLDLETSDRVKLDEPGEGRVSALEFDAAGRLVVTRGGVVSRWDPETGGSEILIEGGVNRAYPLGDGRRLCVWWEDSGVRSVFDPEDGSWTPFPQAHQESYYFNWHPDGSIVVSGHSDGEIRVGPMFSEQPHLLLGHEPGNTSVWVSPDGKWIASVSSGDGTLYLWPIPDLSKPPLHTLPHDELMAKLKSLTNLRAVPDEESHSGYRIEADFSEYRGWGTVPEW
jgi:WD40 repeat protein